MSQLRLNNSYHSFSALSINADYPVAGAEERISQGLLPGEGEREKERTSATRRKENTILECSEKHGRHNLKYH